MARFFKFILVALLAFLLLILGVFKLLFRFIRGMVDLGRNAYGSVKNSDGFAQAYQNFASNEYSKSRLSIPEEVIALMAKVAKSDGQVSKIEVEFMSDTIKSMLNGMRQARVPSILIDSTKRKLFSLANKAKDDQQSVQYYCQSLSQSNEQVRTGVFFQLITFATLDGLSDSTREILNEIGRVLLFDEAQVANMINQVLGGEKPGAYPSDKDPYKELGCSETDEFVVIKKSYRKLVKRHHPDYMHGQGMDDDEIRQGTEKMQEINAAFEEIKRRRAL